MSGYQPEQFGWSLVNLVWEENHVAVPLISLAEFGFPQILDHFFDWLNLCQKHLATSSSGYTIIWLHHQLATPSAGYTISWLHHQLAGWRGWQPECSGTLKKRLFSTLLFGMSSKEWWKSSMVGIGPWRLIVRIMWYKQLCWIHDHLRKCVIGYDHNWHCSMFTLAS